MLVILRHPKLQATFVGYFTPSILDPKPTWEFVRGTLAIGEWGPSSRRLLVWSLALEWQINCLLLILLHEVEQVVWSLLVGKVTR